MGSDSSKIDILAINETKLDSSIGNSELEIIGYDIVRRDRELNGRRGVECAHTFEEILIIPFEKT